MALVTYAPYRRVQHPFYLFQVVMLLGVLLLLSTAVSLCIMLLRLECAGFKVADGEAHLVSVHGSIYRNYMARTGRFLPRL